MQLYSIVALLAAAAAVMAAGPSVNTPTTSIIAGVPTQITWSGGQAPYTLVINTFANGAQTGVVKSISGVNSPYTYTPPSSVAGQQLQFDVSDATGAQGQSGGTPKVMAGSGGSGSDSSSSAAGGSSSAASSSAASSSAAASSAPASSSAADKSSSAAHSSAAASSAAPSSTESKKSPAGTVRVASAAVAGVVGVAAAALL